MTTKSLSVNDLKPLTTEQYDTARAKALDRVQARIGERPSRAVFKRELGSIATPLDWLALLVFMAALVISSAHIIQYMKAMAAASYHDSTGAGVYISLHAYTLAHELGAILLAEAAAILFMTMHNIGTAGRAQRRGILRVLSIPLVLAITASLFVFAANAASGVNVLVSLMPPLFTLGVGLRLEALIVETLHRREDITRRYLAALAVYEASSADPSNHPDYRGLLRQEVWGALMKLTTNKVFADAPSGFKALAVRREMERDTWTVEAVAEVETVEIEVPTRPLVESPARRSGPVLPTLAAPDDMPVMQSANGHTAPVSASHPE